MSDFLPHNDGIDHINIYSKGATELGRILGNMYWMDPPAKMGHHGPFRTIEGWWYYVKLCQLFGDKFWQGKDTLLFDLQVADGFTIKKIAREILKDVKASTLKKWDKNKHRDMMIVAFQVKVKTVPGLKEMLAESTLPFDHYYVYGKGSKAVRKNANPEHDWQIEAWNVLRRNARCQQ